MKSLILSRKRIEKIKECLVATAIMHTSRTLDDEKRRTLETYIEFLKEEEDKSERLDNGNYLLFFKLTNVLV